LQHKEAAGVQREHVFEQVVRLNYLLFLPQAYGANPDERWPLILFLHGSAGRGDDLELVKIKGMPRIVEQQPDFPFIVLSPQCPTEQVWVEHLLTLEVLLHQLVGQCAVDADRIYLTGFSMGGTGTWALAITRPQLFAAIAPICGRGLSNWARALKDLPAWVFHGADDPVVPLVESERMVEALKACGGDVRFTVYPGVGHDSWTRTYEDGELYKWFLQHRRKGQQSE
jgi:predicted peptidase